MTFTQFNSFFSSLSLDLFTLANFACQEYRETFCLDRERLCFDDGRKKKRTLEKM